MRDEAGAAQPSGGGQAARRSGAQRHCAHGTAAAGRGSQAGGHLGDGICSTTRWVARHLVPLGT
jgi:hypothetical protein